MTIGKNPAGPIAQTDALAPARRLTQLASRAAEAAAAAARLTDGGKRPDKLATRARSGGTTMPCAGRSRNTEFRRRKGTGRSDRVTGNSNCRQDRKGACVSAQRAAAGFGCSIKGASWIVAGSTLPGGT